MVLPVVLVFRELRNGSVSCIGVPAAVPGGIRAVACENLIAAMLDLENASSNDQTFTHSDLRRVARSIPQFIPGTDYICSGYSATPNYDKHVRWIQLGCRRL